MLSKNSSIIWISCLTLQFYHKGQDLLLALSVFLNNTAFFSEQLFCKQDEEEVTVQWMIPSTSHTSFLHAELHTNKDSKLTRNCDLHLFYFDGQIIIITTTTYNNLELRGYIYSGCVICACFIEQSMQMLHDALVLKGPLSGELITNATNHSCKIQRGKINLFSLTVLIFQSKIYF